MLRRLTISVRLVAIYALAIPLVLLALDVAEPFVWAPIVVFLAFPILFVVWLAFAFRSAVTSIFALRDRAWMRAIVFAIFPLVASRSAPRTMRAIT